MGGPLGGSGDPDEDAPYDGGGDGGGQHGIVARAGDLAEDEHAPERRDDAGSRGDEREGDGGRQVGVGQEPHGLRDGPHHTRGHRRQRQPVVDHRRAAHARTVDHEPERRRGEDARKVREDIVQVLLWTLAILLEPVGRRERVAEKHAGDHRHDDAHGPAARSGASR